MKIGEPDREIDVGTAKQSYTWLAVALTAGLAMRLFFVLRFGQIGGDTLVYGDIAKNLLLHHVYGFTAIVHGATGSRPTLIRLPGYPLFLALCFKLFGIEHYRAVMFVQLLVDLWTCLLVGGAAACIFGEKAWRWAVWMAALCPFTAAYVAAPLTETLTLFCIALAFYGLVRWDERVQRKACRGINRWLFCIAAALAYAILLRPEQGLLAASVVPAMLWINLRTWWTRQRWKSVLPVLLVSLLTLAPLAPWALRNWHTFRVFQPLAPRFANDPGEVNPSGFQRWYKTWAIDFASTYNVYWNYDGFEIQIGSLPPRAFDTQKQYARTKALLDEYNVNTTSTSTLDAGWNALAEERIRESPLRYYVPLPAARVLNMMFRPRLETLPMPIEWWKRDGHPLELLLAWVFGLLNLVYFVVAVAGLAQRRWPALFSPVVVAMLATIVLRVALLWTLDNSETRYTLEFFPVLIVFGAGWLGTRTRQPCPR